MERRAGREPPLVGAPAAMSWAQFLRYRDEQRERALEAAASALAGDLDLAVALLAGWRLDDVPGGVPRLIERLLLRPARPSAEGLGLLFAPLVAHLAPQPASVPRPVHLLYEHLGSLGLVADDPGPVGRLAWALHMLSWVGPGLELRERMPWRQRAYAARPLDDERALGLWSAWCDGSYRDDSDAWYQLRDGWEREFLRPAKMAFSGVLSARGRAAHSHRVTAGLREQFFFTFLGHSDAPVTGWMQLLARVVETTGPGPEVGLARAVDAAGWRRAAASMTRRGHWPETAAWVFPDFADHAVRARRLETLLGENPDAIAGFLDMHVGLRLIERCQDRRSDQAASMWDVVRNNRGRARARLRGLIAASEVSTQRRVLQGVDGLHARTTSAMRAYARDWAWRELPDGFSFLSQALVEVPCPNGPIPPSLDESSRQMLQSFVNAAIVKERLEHLRNWIRHGGAGDRCAKWGALLTDYLPESLRDPVRPGRKRRSMKRARAELAEGEKAYLRGALPFLRATAAIDEDARDRARRFDDVLDTHWHPEVRRPRVRVKRYVQAARAALEFLEDPDVF